MLCTLSSPTESEIKVFGRIGGWQDDLCHQKDRDLRKKNAILECAIEDMTFERTGLHAGNARLGQNATVQS